MGEIAASVLLKLYINGNGNKNVLTPTAHVWNSIFKCIQHTSNDPKGPEKINNTSRMTTEATGACSQSE